MCVRAYDHTTTLTMHVSIFPSFSQVEFLNSVIADLQRKLETAEALAGLHGPIEGEE